VTRTVAALFCLVVLSTAFAGDTLWTRRYAGPAAQDDEACIVLVDSLDNVIIVGTVVGVGSGLDIAVVKYGPAGNQIWARGISGPGASNDRAGGACIARDGTVYVSGSTGAFPDYNVLTVGIDASGNEVLRETYAGEGGQADAPAAIAVSPTGALAVAGYTTALSGRKDALLWLYDQENGARGFSFSRGIDDAATDVKFGPTGIHMCGTSTMEHSDYFVRKLDLTGVVEWLQIYNGPGNAPDAAVGLAVDGDGNSYVTGTSATAPPPGGTTHLATVKLGPAGDTLWTRRYTGVGRPNEAAALALGASAVAVTGTSTGTSGKTDYATVVYSLSGTELWSQRFDGPPGKDDAAKDVAMAPDGRVFVTGTSMGANDRGDFITVRYSAAGLQEYAARYNSPADNDEQATSIALDSRLNFIVLGNSFAAGNYDLMVVKYDSAVSGAVTEQGRPQPRGTALTVGPCPARGLARATWSSVLAGPASLAVFDAAGTVRDRVAVAAGLAGTSLDLSGLVPGVYLVRLEAGAKSAAAKLIVE